MKLYVWENVLTDYTEGLVCILAKSEQQAWQLLYEKDDTAWWDLQGCPKRPTENESYSESAMRYLQEIGQFKFGTAVNPVEVTEPTAFVVWGGG